MGKVFRLHRSSLRTKIAYFSALGFAVTALVLSTNLGTTLGADPSFISPVTVAGGNRLYYDISVRIRPTDGAAFVIGNKGDYVGLSVTNPANPNAALGFQNIVAGDGGYGYKYPSLAFSSNGTGYAVWRTVNDSRGRNFEAYLRVIPSNYLLNGNGNTNLGTGYYLTDRIPGNIKLDQPSVSVLNDGRVVVVGYYAASTTQLAMITFDANINYQGMVILGNQPSGARTEMDPQMCIDANNNIHIITISPLDGSRVAIYSQVGGGSFTVTDITPSGYDSRAGFGRSGKDVVCGPTNDGVAYAAVKSSGQYMFYKRAAGPGQVWGNGGQPNIYNLFGYPNLTSLAITTSPDGRIYAAQGDGDNGSARPGTYLKYSDDGGNTFFPFGNNALSVVPKSTYSNVSVGMDGNGPGGKIHLASSFTGQLPESTFYTYAPVIQDLAPATNLVATPVSFNRIDLTWTASASASSSTTVQYNVFRSLSPNSGFVQIASNQNATPYQDSCQDNNVSMCQVVPGGYNLKYGTTYYYKVQAVTSSTLYRSPAADSNVAGATTFAPVGVVFLSAPTNPGQAGATNYQPTVKVVDQTNATVTNYSGTVTFSITPGTGTPGAILSGTTSQTITNGVSSFTNTALKIANLGTNYRFRATISPLGLIGDSSPFNLTGQLLITPLSSIVETEPFTVTVTVKNFSTNNPATADKDDKYNGSIGLDLTTNPNTAYYFGQTGKVASSGVVTFTNLMIDKAGPGNGFTGTLPEGLGTGALTSVVVGGPYTPPGTLAGCTRILISPIVETCSDPTLTAQTFTDAAGKPVYIDHRPTGNGIGQYSSGNIPLSIPDGAWLDAGCRGVTNNPWGMVFTVSIANNFTISGGNLQTSSTFIRGIYFIGARNNLAVLSVPQGKISMSCTRVEQSPAG